MAYYKVVICDCHGSHI